MRYWPTSSPNGKMIPIENSFACVVSLPADSIEGEYLSVTVGKNKWHILMMVECTGRRGIEPEPLLLARYSLNRAKFCFSVRMANMIEERRAGALANISMVVKVDYLRYLSLIVAVMRAVAA